MRARGRGGAFWEGERDYRQTQKAIFERAGNRATRRDTGHDGSVLKTSDPIVHDRFFRGVSECLMSTGEADPLQSTVGERFDD